MADPNGFQYDDLFARTAAPPRVVGVTKRAKYDFAVAYPDPASMPLAGLLEGLKRGLDEDGHDLALYYNSQGYIPLREYVVAKLDRDRNIQVGVDDIMLGDGSGQPIHLVAESLVDPGDVIFTDDFVYSGTLGSLRRFGADIRGVKTDDDGMIPDALVAAIQQARGEGKRVKFTYLIPTFQNPQGWTMSLARRKAMVAVAQAHDVPILEDDCYIDLRYDGTDVTSHYSLDGTGRVIYVGSFSKCIAPGMRLGYITAPRPVLERVLGAKSGSATNTFAALAVHRFATEHLSDHIEEINDIGRVKRDAMHSALAEHFGDGATWSQPDGGLYIWLQMPEGVDITSIRDKILETDDVGYITGPSFAPDTVSGRNCARLCYGYNTPEEVSEGIARLAAGFRREGVLA